MRSVLLVVGLLGLGTPAVCKERATRSEASKEPAGAQQKSPNIKDDEAVRCILERLEGESGAKGWKVDLKELAGTAREFSATNGKREEKGTVNVSKDYPNQGALRVYVQPHE